MGFVKRTRILLDKILDTRETDEGIEIVAEVDKDVFDRLKYTGATGPVGESDANRTRD